MKIVQINCVYKNGSTGKIVTDIHSSLCQAGYESVVYYGRGKTVKERNVFRIGNESYSNFNHLISLFTGLEYGGCYYSTGKLMRKIKKERPDVVHLHCINGYFVNMYRLLNFLKQEGFSTVLTLHAEFMYTGGCGYTKGCTKYMTGCGGCPQWKDERKSLFFDRTATMWKKMKKAMEGFDKLYVVSVSPCLMERAQQATLLQGKRHCTVLNGLDTTTFVYEKDEELAKELGIENKKVILHVTSDFHNKIKGGRYVIELARRFEKRKDVVFVVVGAEGQCDLSNLIFAGKVQKQKKLANYYSMAQITLLTSQYETFSMPVAESLCCGTPVVGFCAWAPERIALKEHSAFVEYGNVDLLEEELTRWLDLVAIDKVKISQESCSYYTKENMVEEYKRLYENMRERK